MVLCKDSAHLGQFIIGTAGWAIPSSSREKFFAGEGKKLSHLQAYSARFSGVEINSSFYREHQGKTYQRWAAETPDNFRFSVKLAKRFTHEQRLDVKSEDLQEVLEGIFQLQEKLGVILVQLPPSLAFAPSVAFPFFKKFRKLYEGPVAFEVRHESWGTIAAGACMQEFNLSPVMADPDKVLLKLSQETSSLSYFRLHGSPQIYYSNYDEAAMKTWLQRIQDKAVLEKQVWCIFDNTALGHATENALQMQEML